MINIFVFSTFNNHNITLSYYVNHKQNIILQPRDYWTNLVLLNDDISWICDYNKLIFAISLIIDIY